MSGSRRPLRIDFIAGSLGQGGAERQLHYILGGLAARGHSVGVLAFTRGEYWEHVFRQSGVRVTDVGAGRSRLRRLLTVTRAAARNRSDVLHSMHFYANVYAGLAARALGRRAIGSVRSTGIRDLRGAGRFGGLCLRLPHIVAANSIRAIDDLRAAARVRTRFYHLPNVVDTRRFRPADGRSDDGFTLLFVGRLEPVKRADRFLEVAAAVRRQAGPRVRALVAGDGELSAEIRRQAGGLGLDPQAVTFLGRVNEMPAVYQRSDAVVVTSEAEGCPNAVLEAMSCGVPVVAPSVGGIPELVAHGRSGLLLDQRAGVAAYVAAVLRLIGDPDLRLRLGSAARAQIEATRSLHALPRYLEELYEQRPAGASASS